MQDNAQTSQVKYTSTLFSLCCNFFVLQLSFQRQLAELQSQLVLQIILFTQLIVFRILTFSYDQTIANSSSPVSGDEAQREISRVLVLFLLQ